MAISIKNISLSPLSFDGSLIIEGLSIAAGATKDCNSHSYEVWANAQLRNYVAANSAEIFIGGQSIGKEVALALFDDTNNVSNEVTATTSTYTASIANDIIFADAAAAGGSVNVVLPAPATCKGKEMTVCLSTAGVVQVSPASGSIMIGISVANIQSRNIDDAITLVSDGVNWVVKEQQTHFGKTYIKGAWYEGRFLLPSLITGTIDDWAIASANPNESHFLVGATGTATITGIVPNSILDGQIIRFTCLSGTLQFSNNNVGSAAQNRLSIGSNETVNNGKCIAFKYYINTQRWVLWSL